MEEDTIILLIFGILLAIIALITYIRYNHHKGLIKFIKKNYSLEYQKQISINLPTLHSLIFGGFEPKLDHLNKLNLDKNTKNKINAYRRIIYTQIVSILIETLFVIVVYFLP
jgi:hypothetical protein